MTILKKLKKTVIALIWVSIIAVCCAMCSFFFIFRVVARENVLVSTMLNFAFIVIIIIWSQIEILITRKIQSRQKDNRRKPNVLSEVYHSVSFTSALYMFHFGVQICVAIISAEPGFPVLGDMSDYFLSVQYGLLILLAGDMFSQRIFKDLFTRER